jgi:hypothetical protein
MKISKITIVGLLVVFLSGMTACTEWLDVKPESEIILDEFWKSETDVESVLAACYRGLTEDGVVYRMIIWGELRSDNLTRGVDFHKDRLDMKRILEGDITPSNSYCSWGPFYKIINYCNTILHYAPYVLERDNNFTKADYQKVKSEVLAIRALCYFYLVRSFKEVPYITDASIDDTQNYSQPKNSEAFVLSKIIADLDTAKIYARTDYGRKDYNKGRITRTTINAILADVYLWNEQYDKCIASCNEVMADNSLKLLPAQSMFSNVFYFKNSSESIFELQFKDNVQENNPVRLLYGSSGYPFGELSFPSNLAYDADSENKVLGAHSPFVYTVTNTVIESSDDIRAKDSYESFGSVYFIFKYAGIVREENMINGISHYFRRSNTANWILYRLSDIMLMKAEALVQLAGDNNVKQAFELLNTTYLRSNSEQDSLKMSNYSVSEYEKLVLRERQRELLFEGKRWFDLVRMARRHNSTSEMNDYVDHKSIGASSSLGAPVLDAMYMPVSRGELEANSKLVQNPYYQETRTTTKK